MSDYCHLCDADPCYCGQHGKVASAPASSGAARSGPRGIDPAMREFVLQRYEAGVLENWVGWLRLLEQQFGPDKGAVRNAWNGSATNCSATGCSSTYPRGTRRSGARRTTRT